MKQKILTFFATAALLVLTSCGGTDDYPGGSHTNNNSSSQTDQFANYKASAHQLQKSTTTDGFNIVIMCDGYTDNDIKNGAYDAAVQKTIDALFNVEPMASLKQYCNVYEVVVPSQVSGITTKKRDTAFETYIPDPKNSTNIEGSFEKVQMYSHNAIGKLQREYDKTLAIVLCNSAEYAGTTYMACDSTVTDKIPGGFSAAFIPINAKVGTKEYFEVLVQHEAVGHGIGKLGDEYVYDQIPAKKDLDQYNKGTKYGLYANIFYTEKGSTEDKKDTWHYMQGGEEKTLEVFSQDIAPTNVLYPLAKDADYAAEDLKWYRGGFTFKTQFYRPTINYIIQGYPESFISIMGSSTAVGQKKFNVPSRLVIYKRIMKAANGGKWSCDLTKAPDFNAFKTFDAPARSSFHYSGAKGSAKASSPLDNDNSNLPEYTTPRIVNF